MLNAFGPDIWIADGPNISVAGFHYPSRMVIIKLSNEDLFILSKRTRKHTCATHLSG
jgi:hypothetical protein